MHIRNARLGLLPIAAAAALFGLTLVPETAAAQQGQWSQEQRAACENDAMRLCGDFVPDVDRITACMRAKRAYLSPRCRAVFGRHRR